MQLSYIRKRWMMGASSGRLIWLFRCIMKVLKAKQFGCSTKTQSRLCAFWADKNQSILNNISDFAGENELMNKEKAAVWAKFAYTSSDRKVYNVDYYKS